MPKIILQNSVTYIVWNIKQYSHKKIATLLFQSHFLIKEIPIHKNWRIILSLKGSKMHSRVQMCVHMLKTNLLSVHLLL